jgi:hypothetical protein
VPRAPSVFQETVKQGRTTAIDQIKERVLSHAGLEADLLEVAADGIAPRRISVVFANPGHPPGLLIDNMFAALELDHRPPKPRKAVNRSLGLIEVEMMCRFNLDWDAHVGERDRSRDLRKRLVRMFWSDLWKQQCPHVPIPIPEDLAVVMAERQQRFLTGLEALKQRFAVRTFGTLEPDP